MTRIAEITVTGGVDTHKDFHVAAALDQMGRLLGTEQFPSSSDGHRQLDAWLRSFGELDVVGIEGTGSWGAGLSRFFRREGIEVREVNRPNRQRRRKGKSDPADAISAARSVQSGEASGLPKAGGGPVESIRVLRVTRRSAVKARTQALNQIKGLIDTAPDELRERFIHLPNHALITSIRRFRQVGAPGLTHLKTSLKLLAGRVIELDQEVTQLDELLAELLESTAPTLMGIRGVGPESAGALLVAAGDNPDRLRSEPSFASLCGVSPLDASSGRQQRHRLNRGGDRQANCALFRIVLCRLAWDQQTKAYMARRIAEGKTKREVIRCLKRYVAREVFAALQSDFGCQLPECQAAPRAA
jgi:transposase